MQYAQSCVVAACVSASVQNDAITTYYTHIRNTHVHVSEALEIMYAFINVLMHSMC